LSDHGLTCHAITLKFAYVIGEMDSS
jgi:hypothetical protein